MVKLSTLLQHCLMMQYVGSDYMPLQGQFPNKPSTHFLRSLWILPLLPDNIWHVIFFLPFSNGLPPNKLHPFVENGTPRWLSFTFIARERSAGGSNSWGNYTLTLFLVVSKLLSFHIDLLVDCSLYSTNPVNILCDCILPKIKDIELLVTQALSDDALLSQTCESVVIPQFRHLAHLRIDSYHVSRSSQLVLCCTQNC